MSQAERANYKKVKSILISLPKPVQKSPYQDLELKYGLKIDFREFTHVEAVTVKEVRRQKVNPAEFSSVILPSKHSVDHFFRTCNEMRIKMSEDTKYFCMSESIANYLQKFIVYRKRKVFFVTKDISELKSSFLKHKEKETFLLPISNLGAKDVTNFLTEINVKYTEAMMYAAVSSDLSDLKDIFYDVLAFFSPLAIKSLWDNFPDFKQNDTRIAVFGQNTHLAAVESGLIVNISAPSPESPSMPMALEKYIQPANKE